MKLPWIILAFVLACGGFFLLRPNNAKHQPDPQISKQLMEFISNSFRPSVVKIKASGTVLSAIGTGFYINSSGDILTAYHVIEGAGYFEVSNENQDLFRADVIGVNAKYDLAILRLRTSSATPSATLGYTTQLEEGEPLVAIGNSKNEFLASKYGQFLHLDHDALELAPPDLIVSDVPVDHGDSGGPVLNSKGIVIGVTDAISRNARGEFESYFVPMSVLQPLILKMQAGQMDGIPGLGFQVLDSSEIDDASVRLPDNTVHSSVMVIYVTPNSMADRAGVLPPGRSRISVLKALDGTPIESVRQLYWVLSSKNVGDTVNAEFFDLSYGKQTVAIKLEPRR
jgi:serine protease Do